MLLNTIRLLSACRTTTGRAYRHQLSGRWIAILQFVFCLLALYSVSGCSSGLATKAGAISVTYPNGITPGQLPILSTAAVAMTPTNDIANLGVDWTLTCGGNAQIGYTTTGCGTLVPAHTPSGVAANYTAPGIIPADNIITITARVSSDPSQTSSVTMTIVNLPVVVALATVPTSLAVDGAANLSAVVGNDISAQGVRWTVTCGASSCGSFTPMQTLGGVPTVYTAPSVVPPNGSVTITATSVADSTKQVSSTITVLPITVAVSPSAFDIATSGTASLTAKVVNDVKNAGVTWSCNSSNCGTFSSTQTANGVATTYTAPSAVPAGSTVKITATSVADGSTSATAIASVSASSVITVKITQSPSSLDIGKGATVKATVTGDASNAGVDWTATCGSAQAGACGTFNPTTTASAAGATYTAPSTLPANNPLTITATSHAKNLNPSLLANQATATITISAPPSIAFTQQPPASITASGTATVGASVTNDAATGGGITWTVQCSNTTDGACGYVTPYKTSNGAEATYVAPPISPGVPVSIKATSSAFLSTSVLSNAIAVVASDTHSIAFVPFAPSQMEMGTTVMLNAAVINDPSHAGVDWTVCPNGCGFFTIKPAIPAIPAVPPSAGDPGSPYVPAIPAVIATSAMGWPNGVSIPYTAPTVAPSNGAMIVTATATADRLNNASSSATAVASIAIVSTPTGPDLHGVVQAGTQPVVGASVYLFAAGTTGYASASTPISSPKATSAITTDSAGRFTIPAGYSCPQLTSQVYLLAIGGQVGSSGPNPNLALMTALGSCSNLSSTKVVLNEITTEVSAAALATFSADNIQTGETSYLYIGSSAANATTGLANAFASVNNLVDITTGQPKFWTVAGNAAVPYVKINTLADALNACAVTSGGSAGDGTTCGDLFTYTNPLSTQYPSFAPKDTLQAIFDLSKPPSPDITNELQPQSVYGLVTQSSPYQPILSSSPDEWAISLNYTAGGGVGGSGATGSGSSSFALDASGNLWIANMNTNSVSEWNNLGAPISPADLSGLAGGFTAGGINAPSAIAIDPTGYVWIVNGNSTLTKLDSNGTADVNSPFRGGGLLAGTGIAIDGSSNVWVTNGGSPGSVAKFNTRGIAQSPSTGYTGGIADPSVIAIDGSDNVWVYNQEGNSTTDYVQLNDASGSFTLGVSGDFANNPTQLAIDRSRNIWSAAGGIEVLKIPASYTGLVAGPQPAIYPANSSSSGNFISGPQGMAFDGSDRLWVANAGSSENAAFPFSSLSLLDTTLPSPDVTIHYVDADLSNGPSSVAVDSAGNVWLLLGNNTMKEYVGLATPVVTPLSVGVEKNQLGSKP